MKTLALAFIAMALAGCGTRVAPFNPDKEFLVMCKPMTPLKGLTGADFIAWAEVNGPEITECIRIHNGLVTIIKSQP